MKKLILVIGAGSGIGASIFDFFKAKNDKDIFLLGFSRRGIRYENQFFCDQNLKFDANKSEDYDQFEKGIDHLLNANVFDALVVYFAQGDGLFKPIEEIDKSELFEHFNLNLFSSISLLKILTPNLKKFGQSTIIFLSSTASRMGFSHSTAYCASKHAVAGLAKALREEWKPMQVKVVNAYLGAVATSIWDGRTDFSKNDMISVADAGEFLASLSYLPQTLYLDEVYITPKKGVL